MSAETLVFTALNTPVTQDAEYESTCCRYRIRLSSGGFGIIPRSHLHFMGQRLGTFEGREALDLASVAAQQHFDGKCAVVHHENGDGV